MTALSFADLLPGPREHFRLHALAAAARVIDQAGQMLGSHEGLLEQFPFIAGYLDEMDGLGALPATGEGDGDGAQAPPFNWEGAIASWQSRAAMHLPLAALGRAAGLDFTSLTLLCAAGLLEEDARFGALFEAMQGIAGQQRPTAGLFNAWWRAPVDDGGVRARLRRLRELGLIEVVNPEAPRSLWALQAPPLVWDALRDDLPEAPAPFLRHVRADIIAKADEPILDETLRATVDQLPALLGAGDIDAVIVRGPHRNGRRTLLRWIARRCGRGVLEVDLSGKPETDRDRLRIAAPLSTLLRAMPLFVLDPAPGEMIELPRLVGGDGPIGVVMGRSGGVGGTGVERAITLPIEMPIAAARARHLRRRLARPPATMDELASHFRMTSGNLHRAAGLAEAHAALAARGEITVDDVRQASRWLGRQSLDTLALRLPDAGSWSDFAAAGDTLRELRILEHRCRHRERLGSHVGDALSHSLNCGVRALLQGPSGTGKTLAARLLAGSLQKDIYRVDLSAVVNKYIGETEKNLARVFAVAEELDIILLFDEGDSLLARRTGVSNANDRYANLETNFLLQRLESFEGIAVVTTNASELIDGAFQRRMDVVVDFRLPDAAERWQIWQMHLPARHSIEPAFVREAASRCQLSGGQIRNAALHASLLAIDSGGIVDAQHVEAALLREYRKSGGVCPLRMNAAAAAVGRA